MEKPRIGLIGLTLELYKKKRPELIPRLENFSTELQKSLAETADIVHFPVAWNKETISKAFSAFAESGVNGVIIVFLSYAPSMAVIPALKKLKVPVLIFNTQKLETISAGFNPKDSFGNHGMHGVQDLSSVMLREGLRFSLVTGHYKNSDALARVSSWCSAALASSKMDRARIGRIGGLFPEMGDFALEPGILKEHLGPATVDIPVKELSEFAKFPAPSKEDIRRHLNFRARWDKDIPAAVRADSIKSFFFLKRLAGKYGISGWAVNFQGLKGKKMPMPFLAISCLLSEGMGYGGEGDIYSSSAVFLAQSLSGRNATFTEMFTTDYKKSRIYMTHMGESNLSLRRKGEPVRMVLNKMELGNSVPTVVPVFSIKPGDYTLLNLASSGKSGLKMIMGRVKVLDRKPFKEMRTPHFLLSPRGRPVEEFLTAYSMEGGTHHLALAAGDIIEKVKFFSFMKKLPLAEI